MDTIGKFFELIARLYAFPLHQYDYCHLPVGTKYVSYEQDPSCGRDWAGTIMSGVLIYGITLIFVLPLTYWLYHAIRWRVVRKRCQHSECGHAWTEHISDGSSYGCTPGEPCCTKSQEQHYWADLHRRAEEEPKRPCPNNHGDMNKVVKKVGAIIDECPACGYIGLDRGELEQIEDVAYKRGYDDGDSDGSTDGMLLGFVVGSVVN